MASTLSSDAPSARRVLVCEDDPRLARLFVTALSGAGVDAHWPGPTALDALVEAAARRPDLALVDLSLKGALDGRSVAERLHEEGVPVAFATGCYRCIGPSERRIAREVLIKPVMPAALVGCVSGILGEAVRGPGFSGHQSQADVHCEGLHVG